VLIELEILSPTYQVFIALNSIHNATMIAIGSNLK